MENIELIEKSYEFMYWNLNKQNLPHLSSIRLVSEESDLQINHVHKKKELIKKIELFHNNPQHFVSKLGDFDKNIRKLPNDNAVLEKVDYEMNNRI
jgi:hypothetical protein